MLPSSHVVPINRTSFRGLEDPRALADAFSEFMAASVQLEASYRGLQQEVSHLSVELAARNSDLTRSVAENGRMRATLQQMLDSMPCGVLVLDTRETVAMINPEGRKLLALGDTSVRTVRELVRVTGIDFESLSNSVGERDCTEVSTDFGGEHRWLAIGRRELGCMHENHSGRGVQSVWILRDITDEKRMAQEREAARRTATLAEISAVLAHEIRNPLASLELFAGLVADDNANRDEWVANLRAGIRTLSGTVSNVLSMHANSALRLVSLDLVAAIRASVEFVRPIAQQAEVELTFTTHARAIAIDGNEEAIRQIVLNLLRNAIRHTAQSGSVDVSIRRVNRAGHDLASVEIRDTGCGIDAQLISRIFEAGVSGTGETPGIGLAVCRRLAAQHKGTIGVTSRVGEGSTFYMEFPAI